MAWDYAELSKMAKKAGGPEKLVDMIEQGGKAIGRSEGKASMTPWIGVAALGGSLITAAVIKIVDYLNEKKAVSQVAVDKAKAELVQGIKEYDAAHPDNDEGSNLEDTVTVEEHENDEGDLP